jgi:YHS domain-containing protein
MYNASRHSTSIVISAIVRVATPLAFFLLAAALAPSVSAQPAPETPLHADRAIADAPDGDVTPVQARFVCMITNKVFVEEQIRIPLDDRVYYGCCQMCVAKINDNKESRYTTDPVTGKRVNKADAVIGADESGAVYYFESNETLDAFNAM